MDWSPFRRLFHWGPIAVLTIIKLITYCMVDLIGMWWPPGETVGGTLHAALFLFLAAATFYYFLNSLIEGPGFVPLGWKPSIEEHKHYLQYCTVCNGYKAPRAHHCKKCGACVLKMDHHCPWINTCVGHNNHGYFISFLLFAWIGCLHAAIVLVTCMYHALNRFYYIRSGVRAPIVTLSLWSLMATLLAIGMSIGVVLAVGALAYFQIKNMLSNKTNIEEWIIEKAMYRRLEKGLPPLVFPYDRGVKKNILDTMFPGPLNALRPPVKEGCGEYDLTIEQLAQKEDKRTRARVYQASTWFGGRLYHVVLSPRVFCTAPCFTEDSYLAVEQGDLIVVTRQRNNWLYGEKLVQSSGDSVRGPRGWFPRRTAVLVDTSDKSD